MESSLSSSSDTDHGMERPVEVINDTDRVGMFLFAPLLPSLGLEMLKGLPLSLGRVFTP